MQKKMKWERIPFILDTYVCVSRSLVLFVFPTDFYYFLILLFLFQTHHYCARACERATVVVNQFKSRIINEIIIHTASNVQDYSQSIRLRNPNDIDYGPRCNQQPKSCALARTRVLLFCFNSDQFYYSSSRIVGFLTHFILQF